jgi:hypothetical protein
MLEIKEYAFNFILSTRVQPSKSLSRSGEKDLEGFVLSKARCQMHGMARP